MKSVAVIGLGQFGSQLAIGLTQKGFEVLAVDKDPEVVAEVKDLVSQPVALEATDEKAMRAVNVGTIDTAIVAIGTNVQASLLCTALLQKMNVEDIHVRAIEPLQESILRTMGITKIIDIEKEMGIQLANSLSSGIGRYIAISDRHSLMETVLPPRFVGKSLRALDLRAKYQINIVGIKTQIPVVGDDGEVSYREKMTDIPDPQYPLAKDDILVIAGTDQNLRKFLKWCKKDDE